jgi:DNA-binding beta-propeller fold protein YncE
LDGDLTDFVYTVDASDPRALTYDDRGPSVWGPFRYIQVPADPWSIVINPTDGRAYGLGLTTHEVFALDLVSNPIRYVDMKGERSVSSVRFTDADGSGSDPDFKLLSVNAALLENETIRIQLAGGTLRLYHPAPGPGGIDSLFRADSGDAGATFVDAAGGADLVPTSEWAAAGIGALAVGRVSGRLEGLVAGTALDGARSIGRIQSNADALDIDLFAGAEIVPTVGGWDAGGVFDPDFWVEDGIYDAWWTGGSTGFGRAIGHASGSNLSALQRAGDPTLVDGEDGLVLERDPSGWDSGGVVGPAVLRTGTTGEWFLYYTGYAAGATTPGGLPPGLAIGLAVSSDAVTYARSPFGVVGTSSVLQRGAPGEWDDVAVAQPSVLFRNGRYHMWYQGFDGGNWSTGLAHSTDGLLWTKDDRNPVFRGVVDADGIPRRAFMFAASNGGYYHLEGDVSGRMSDFAEEGAIFVGSSSPLSFRIVGGQALGQGDSGTFDAGGVGSPAPTGVNGLVAYLGHDGGRRRVGLAVDAGAALIRTGVVTFAGFTGSLESLNGDDPTAVPLSLDVRTDSTGLSWAAIEVGEGISLASGNLTQGSTMSAVPGATPAVTTGEAGTFHDEAVRSASLLLTDDGLCRLYFEADDGTTQRIGLAVAQGCENLAGSEPVIALDRGAAGTWDDGALRSPTVLFDPSDDLFHMWYVGSDGDTDAVGYATSTDGTTWERHRDGSGTVPVYDPTILAFAGDGVTRLAAEIIPTGYQLWFEGDQSSVRRIGRARSPNGSDFIEVPNPTTAGDYFEIDTRQGDTSPSSGIYLGDSSVSSSPIIDGILVHAAGASDLILSPDGRFGLVANKRAPYVIVVDLYDDSSGDYVDANHHDIEAVIVIPQISSRMVGIRELRFSADGSDLYALLGPLVRPGSGDDAVRRGPEGLLRLDWASFADEPQARAIREGVLTGWMPAARGAEEPNGYVDDVSVGPLGLNLSRDGSRAYFANFNDNSFWILDLEAGARGAIVKIVDGLDERPSEVALSPDEKLAYVSASFGRLYGSAASSTLHVIDIDETSPTFGTVLTTLTNVSSRAEAGCE